MKHLKKIGFYLVALAMTVSLAAAQTGTASDPAEAALTVNYEVEDSITMYFEQVSGQIAVTGADTYTGEIDLGTFSAYGDAPATAGVTRDSVSRGDSSFALNATFGIKVHGNNGTGQYQLSAKLGNGSVPTGATISLDEVELDGSLASIGSARDFDEQQAIALKLVLPMVVEAGSYNQVIEFEAIAAN